MPSTPQSRRLIMDDIAGQSDIGDELTIYELGCGWGGLCRKLAFTFPQADVRGFEISPIPFGVSKMMSILAPINNYFIKRKDLFHIDLSEADIVICYLSPYHMNRFEQDMIQTMKNGSRLYSQGFPLINKSAEQIISAPYSLEKRIFCYEVKI